MMKLVSLAFCFAICAFSATSAFAVSETFSVSKGTEHKVLTAVGIGGEHICFTVRDPQSKTPVLGHFRRTLNGGAKDLDFHMGGRCLNTKPGVYVVYVTAVDQNVEVVVHHNEVHVWKPPIEASSVRMNSAMF